MCGIAGFYCWGNHRPAESVVRNLILCNEERGRDAAGVAFPSNGLTEATANRLTVVKAPLKATEFVKAHEGLWGEVAQSPWAMLHTRARTKGDEKKNENNHPVVGFGWAVTHNGGVMNDDALFDHYKAERFAEVDTAAIPLLLSRGEDLDRSLSLLGIIQGSATIAAVAERDPGTLVLYRGGADLFLMLDPSKDIFYWSSSANGLLEVPNRKFAGLRFSAASKMPLDHAMVLTHEGGRSVKVPQRPFVVPRRSDTSNRGSSKFYQNHGTDNRSRGIVTAPGDIAGRCWSYTPANIREFKDKPMPIIDRKKLSFTYCMYETIISQMKKTNSRSERVDSCYGVWTFTQEDGTVFKQFKPTERCSKLYKGIEGYEGLPSKLLEADGATARFTRLDDKMMLEPIKISEKVSENGVWEAKGYVCPWCGVYMADSIWIGRDGRCPFCHVRSRRR